MSDPVAEYAAAIVSGREPSRAELESLLRLVQIWLGRRPLDPRDREEIAADAVLRLTTTARSGRLDPTRPAGAWLRVVADHLALDLLRRRKPPTLEFDERYGGGQDDDRVAAMLDQTVAADDVSRAMRGAVDDGQYELVRVIATWLDLAHADGKAPSTRQVAERLGVSHTTVRRALDTFGRRLASG
jgi:DNA-directed RNA polymerase specialized sigma24 family protein